MTENGTAGRSGSDQNPAWRLVVTALAEALDRSSVDVPDLETCSAGSALATRDFAELGLASLDWMAMATRVEDEWGVELPDQALLDPRLRCVQGWASVLNEACRDRP